MATTYIRETARSIGKGTDGNWRNLKEVKDSSLPCQYDQAEHKHSISSIEVNVLSTHKTDTTLRQITEARNRQTEPQLKT